MLLGELKSLQQKYDDKEKEVASVKGQLTTKTAECDKHLAAGEAIKHE